MRNRIMLGVDPEFVEYLKEMQKRYRELGITLSYREATKRIVKERKKIFEL